MSFLARFLGWALLLALPGWAFGEAYRAGLATALEIVFAGFGQRVELERVDALAPMDLVLFAALTLASDHWSWRRRARALALGALALIAAQVVGWSLYLGTLMAAASGAASQPLEQLWHSVLGAAGWLAAIAAWALGPGSVWLGRARPAASESSHRQVSRGRPRR